MWIIWYDKIKYDANDDDMNEVHVNRNEMLKWLKSMWNDKMIKEYVKC